jgi:hypothetical protein
VPHALATVQDLEARLGRDLTPTEANRAETLLGDASALVRSYTRQTFDLVEDDELVLRPVGVELRLPQRPVTAVASVAAVGGHDTIPDIPLTGWTFDGIDIVNVDGIDSNVWVSLPAWWEDHGGHPDTYRVVYTHGYATVPPEVVTVVCAMVLRTLTAPSPVEGMVSERIGQYNYQLQQGGGSTGVSVRFTQADKDALIAAGYKRRATTVQVRS